MSFCHKLKLFNPFSQIVIAPHDLARSVLSCANSLILVNKAIFISLKYLKFTLSGCKVENLSLWQN